MSPRAITSLLLAVLLVAMVVGYGSVFLSRSVTDRWIDYPEYDEWKSIVLSEKNRSSYTMWIHNQQYNCGAWMTTGGVRVREVYKRGSSHTAIHGLYEFNVETGRPPQRVVLGVQGRKYGCGYRGRIALEPRYTTPIDFFADLIGSDRPAKVAAVEPQQPSRGTQTVIRRQSGSEAIERALKLSRDQRRQVQRGLNRLGYDTGGVDGVFGRKSRLAIRGWQYNNAYVSTGYLNRRQFLELAR